MAVHDQAARPTPTDRRGRPPHLSAYLGMPFGGRTALLSPFDRLVHDRVRAEALFGFEYVLEMYQPQHQRRWGYFALPILHRDPAAWLRL